MSLVHRSDFKLFHPGPFMNLPTFPFCYNNKGESEQSNLSDKAVLDTIKGKIKFVLTWNCTNELFEISKNKLRILKHMVTASACTEHSSLLHFDKLKYYN